MGSDPQKLCITEGLDELKKDSSHEESLRMLFVARSARVALAGDTSLHFRRRAILSGPVGNALQWALRVTPREYQVKATCLDGRDQHWTQPSRQIPEKIMPSNTGYRTLVSVYKYVQLTKFCLSYRHPSVIDRPAKSVYTRIPILVMQLKVRQDRSPQAHPMQPLRREVVRVLGALKQK